MKPLLRFTLAAYPLLALLGCAEPRALLLTPDDPDGSRLAAAVDSPEAHALLVEILRTEPSANPTATMTVETPAMPSADEDAPTQTELNALGRSVSMDFAALRFAQTLLADEPSQPVQALFARAVAEGAAASEKLLRRPGAFPYTVLFAPGWLYEQHPHSGADFGAQRALLTRLGIANRLIPTAESGSVETNALTIAAAVRDGAARGETLLLVGASKAAAEIAYALSTLLTPAETRHVAGWLNASAALGGTPLADWATQAPLSWAVQMWARFADLSLDGVLALRQAPSRARLAHAAIPDSVAVVNVVAVPVSGTLNKTMRGGYWIMRNRGPTDGVVPIGDTLWPTGVHLVALGADHLLRDFRDDAKGLALLRSTAFAVGLHRCRLGFLEAAPLEVAAADGTCVRGAALAHAR